MGMEVEIILRILVLQRNTTSDSDCQGLDTGQGRVGVRKRIVLGFHLQHSHSPILHRGQHRAGRAR